MSSTILPFTNCLNPEGHRQAARVQAIICSVTPITARERDRDRCCTVRAHQKTYRAALKLELDDGQSVADQFVETLAAVGVKRIYGIVGDSLNGLMDAIRRQGMIEWIHVRHEEVAAFAAGAEAHVTGELAICAGSCGPGNLHLINGLFDCHRSRVPVLGIAAQIPSAEIGSGYFQETHPQTLFLECSHYCELVAGASQMPIREAVGKRGVAVVVIPGDVALQSASSAAVPKLAGIVPPTPVVVPPRQSGDGGFTMLMGDFLTLAQHRLPVKVVVFNNGALGFIELEQKSTGFLEFGTELKNPNFAAMAEAIGIRGIRLEDRGPEFVRAQAPS